MSEAMELPAQDTPLRDNVDFLLARASALLSSTLNATLAPLGLRMRPFAILALAAFEPKMNQREIAEYLRLDPSQVVTLVDGLESQGWVQRLPDPRDRRTNLVAATAEGLDRLEQARAVTREAEDRLHSDLTAEDLQTLASLLRRIAFI